MTWQYVSAFNQPLDLNTSSVTDISYMFGVRPARALPPISTVGSSPARCLRHRHPTPSRFSARMLPTLHALLSTRQGTTAFNQPLSFDTSKATDMSYMFYVRSARALRPIPSRVFACTLLAPPPSHTLPPPSPHAAHFVCPLFHSAGRDGVQPVSEFRHVQCHNHELHV